MRLSQLKIEMDALETLCSIFLYKDEVVTNKGKSNIVLKVKAFEQIIKECKDKVESSNAKHRAHVLKLLYGLKIDESDAVSIGSRLVEYVDTHINGKHMQTNEHKINRLKSIIYNINTITEEIVVELEHIEDINLRWYRFKGGKLEKYRILLKRFIDLKEKLEIQLERDSKEISFFIIEDFYNIYIYFSFIISLSMQNANEIFLIEIANQLDRYIGVIEPSFGNRFLQHEDMLYHYVIYELKELKNRVLTELTPQ